LRFRVMFMRVSNSGNDVVRGGPRLGMADLVLAKSVIGLRRSL
jgi:hypothetical protein